MVHRSAQLIDRGTGERAPAVERLVQRDAEAELIAHLGRGVTVELLGRHVRRRAEQRTCHREHHRGVDRERCLRARHGFTVEADQAEVADLRDTRLRDEHVRRLEVAVHEAHRVRRSETASRLHEHREHGGNVVRRRHPALERLTGDVLHRDERLAVGDARLEHADDVWIREPCERLRFATEAVLLLRIEPRLEAAHLDRDDALEIRIARAIHRAHCTAADQIEHLEPADPVDGGSCIGRRFAGVARQREHQVPAIGAVGEVRLHTGRDGRR